MARDATSPQDPEAIEGWPPGHFYSPIPSLREVRRRESAIFGAMPQALPGIDLNDAGQVALFHELQRYYAEQPFSDQPEAGRRFGFVNPNFSYGE